MGRRAARKKTAANSAEGNFRGITWRAARAGTRRVNGTTGTLVWPFIATLAEKPLRTHNYDARTCGRVCTGAIQHTAVEERGKGAGWEGMGALYLAGAQNYHMRPERGPEKVRAMGTSKGLGMRHERWMER